MALLGDGVHLCLRGTWADGYERIFRERTQTLGVEKQIHILPPALPEQLVERAAQHDVGLALEPAITQNRRIAVSNKILNYFLAGLAIAATDVPGQRGIMERAPGAGFLFAPGDAETLAARLRDWSINPVKLQSAKAASIRAGKNRFCWDIEKQKLLEAVAQALKS
jgi:glycosyltransferase involved in cell wall biosynthesis